VADDGDLLGRIRALIDALAEDSSLPRIEVEPTLTDGYARALELDAECMRIENRIDDLTRDMAAGRPVPPGELSGLLKRLHEATRECQDLRELLAPLRKLAA
jgi:hypothetical protein